MLMEASHYVLNCPLDRPMGNDLARALTNSQQEMKASWVSLEAAPPLVQHPPSETSADTVTIAWGQS